MGLTFSKLRKINQKRNTECFNENIYKWNETDWTNAICGEAGEAANIAKKRSRYLVVPKERDNIPDIELGKELADIVLYCDLLATKLGYKLEDLIKDKFNEVSDRYDYDIKL